MSKSKKYFWLKQPANFFQEPKIKKLRKIAGGDTLTIIYQKLMLLSIVNGGVIVYDDIEETLEEELSLILDEELENIKLTLIYLQSQKLIEKIDDKSYLLSSVPNLIGSETDSAERVRKLRASRDGKKALQCNIDVTNSNTELEKEIELNIEKDIDTDSRPKKTGKPDKSDKFNMFWDMYNKKRDKKKTEKLFSKLKADDIQKIFDTLPMYIVSTPDIKFRKDPKTYLYNECWNDEIPASNSQYTKDNNRIFDEPFVNAITRQAEIDAMNDTSEKPF